MVSVVITTCKRTPDILQRAINSVLSQTYCDWELIIVDDSPDSYAERPLVKQAIEQYQEARIRYVAHEENKGACAARNTGLSLASGEYIAYLDDDDEWLPQKLAVQVQKLEQLGEKVAMIYCGSYVKNDVTGETVLKKQQFYGGDIFDSLILENYIGSTSFPLIRTNVLKEIGGFDILMQSAQDYDVWLRIAEKYEVDFVEEPLVCYHIHGGLRITTNIAKRIGGLERLNDKNQTYLTEHPIAFCIRYMKLARVFAKGGKLAKALRIWCRAVLRCPWRVAQNGEYLIQILSEKFRSMRK